ncbi:MAG: tetratricopeptide repeat protein, partial [Thermoanaerobaculia bacterium]|nr:tetratricopeptide repeat protein [Thermoanaerobaculia bacterium]
MGRKARIRREKPAAHDAPSVVERTSTPVTSLFRAAVSIVLIILVAIIYAQVRTHEFLNFDDPIYVTDNVHVNTGFTASGIAWAFKSVDVNWHPLTWLTHMLDVQLFGLNPGAHLLVNATLHAVNAVLLFFLLLRLTAKPWRSAIVAAIFATHPLHVESVAWLSERKDVLSTLFFLLTILLYAASVRSRSRPAYAGMLVTFALGLMAKGTLVTIPFLLLVIDYWPLQRAESFRARVVEKWPLFAISFAASVITFIAQRGGGAVTSASRVSFPVRAANAVIAYTAYVRKALWPADLIVPYEYPRSISSVSAIVALIVLLAITAAVIFARDRRFLFTGWFWFVGTLVPMIGLVQIGPQWMADRYMYVPMIGLSMALVWMIAELARSQTVRAIAACVAAVWIVALALTAHAQTAHWRTSRTLFSHTLAVDPGNRFAVTNLGAAHFNAGEFDEAANVFQRIADARPQDDEIRLRLANALSAAGRTDRAISELRRAIELNQRNAPALVELARLELASGRAQEAEALLLRAVAIEPKPLTLGTLALTRNDLQAARREFERAIQVEPQSSTARNNLAATLARLGMNELALQRYHEAIRLDPTHYDAR